MECARQVHAHYVKNMWAGVAHKNDLFLELFILLQQ